MTWTRPTDLRAQIDRMWLAGDLLVDLVTGESRFPRRLTFKGPTSAEMTECFDEIQS